MSNQVTFDPTVSLGHIITAITMLCAALAAYYALDKRIAILEENRSYQQQKDALQDSQVSEKFSSVKEDLSDIKRTLREAKH